MRKLLFGKDKNKTNISTAHEAKEQFQTFVSSEAMPSSEESNKDTVAFAQSSTSQVESSKKRKSETVLTMLLLFTAKVAIVVLVTVFIGALSLFITFKVNNGLYNAILGMTLYGSAPHDSTMQNNLSNEKVTEFAAKYTPRDIKTLLGTGQLHYSREVFNSMTAKSKTKFSGNYLFAEPTNSYVKFDATAVNTLNDQINALSDAFWFKMEPFKVGASERYLKEKQYNYYFEPEKTEINDSGFVESSFVVILDTGVSFTSGTYSMLDMSYLFSFTDGLPDTKATKDFLIQRFGPIIAVDVALRSLHERDDNGTGQKVSFKNTSYKQINDDQLEVYYQGTKITTLTINLRR